MAASWNDFFPHVLPDVPGCPKAIARTAIRDAAIEFCKRTQLWTAESNATGIVVDEPHYTYAPETGAQVAATKAVWVSGLRIDPITKAILDTNYSGWKTTTGTPSRWYGTEPGTIRLYPIPDEAISGGLLVDVALKPSRTATTCPDFLLEDWAEEIAHGAKSKLLTMKGRPWSGDGRGSYAQFERAIARAKGEVNKSQTGESLSVEIPNILLV